MISILKRFISAIIRRYDHYVRIPQAHKKFADIEILSTLDSIRYIIDHRCSVSRYGDGEIIMIFGEGYSGYQGADALLAMRLNQVLTADDAPNLMIGLPLPLKQTTGLRSGSKEFWDYFTLRKGKAFHELLSPDRTYVDTQLSRFYIMYADKQGSAERVAMLKQIWQDRDVIIIEGKESRTGIGNDLYANVRSLNRIIGYATDAFSHYDEMLDAVQKHVSPDKLILLSYGPTATILAYDLAKLGYQAIDIGHLDIEYEWFRMGVTNNVAIKGKFTNEADGGRDVAGCDDLTYKQQIICDITHS